MNLSPEQLSELINGLVEKEIQKRMKEMPSKEEPKGEKKEEVLNTEAVKKQEIPLSPYEEKFAQMWRNIKGESKEETEKQQEKANIEAIRNVIFKEPEIKPQEPSDSGKSMKQSDIMLREILGVTGGIGARLYVRVSTDKQIGDGHWSLEVQEKRLRDYCKNNGYAVREVYADKGISAKEYRNRPGLIKLLKDLQKLEIVVSVSLNRISRDHINFLEITKQIEGKNAKLILLDQNLDSDTSDGKLMLTIMSAMAQYEREMTAERVRVTMEGMRKLGIRRRYGWKVKDKQMIVVEEEQKIISLIRALRDENPNIPLSEIGRILDRNEIKIRKNKTAHPQAIKRIIDDKTNNIKGGYD